MRTTGVLACVAAAAAPVSVYGSPFPNFTIGPSAMTAYGPVFTENITSTGIASFKGIPYALPPVNDMRWRSPRQPQLWTAPLNATDFNNACYVFNNDSTTFQPQSEDCLYLNVWTGAKNITQRLPVMVWIHGGGFEIDSATNPAYDGTLLAEKGVVLVSFDYRLGNFGYLARTDLDAEDSVGNSGNFGIQDMQLALSWVKNNIDNFGGDPDNVMVFGESAGSHAVGILMASPLSDNLYDKGAMESGSFWNSEHGNMKSFEESRAFGDAWSENFGTNLTLTDLRNVSVEDILSTSNWNEALDPAEVFSPNVDKYVTPEVPSERFIQGLQSRVPLLGGFNKREGTFFEARAWPHDNASEWLSYEAAFYNVTGRNETASIAAVDEFYPTGSIAQLNDSAILQLGDLVISEQTWLAVYLQSKLQQPAYLYHFNFTSARNPVAEHTTEIAYVFGTLDFGAYLTPSAAPSAVDYALSEKMMTYWTNFAKSSNPNYPETLNGTLVNWPAYVAGSFNTVNNTNTPVNQTVNLLLEFDTLADIHVPHYDYRRFNFINSFRGHNGSFPVTWDNFTFASVTTFNSSL